MDKDYELTENVLKQHGGIVANDLSHLLASSSEDYEPRFINHSLYYSTHDMPSFVKSQNNHFTLLSLNAQSINAKISKLQLLIHQLNLQNIRIDAIAIQESWLQFDDDHELSDLTQLSIDGFKF